jgi:hypothetical protein
LQKKRHEREIINTYKYIVEKHELEKPLLRSSSSLEGNMIMDYKGTDTKLWTGLIYHMVTCISDYRRGLD